MAEERGSVASRSNPHRYNNTVWQFADILGIIDRDPAQFGLLTNTTDLRSELHGLLFYRGGEDPRQLLLYALRHGDLAAVEGESRRDKEFWYAKNASDISGGLRRFASDREAVLRLWPPPAAEAEAICAAERHTVPQHDRAEGEPDKPGYRRHVAEEQGLWQPHPNWLPFTRECCSTRRAWPKSVSAG